MQAKSQDNSQFDSQSDSRIGSLKKKVLIIEDNKITSEYESEILKETGLYETEVITNNFQKIDVEFIEKLAPDCIILDINLKSRSSQVSGISISKLIKGDDRTMNIPIIVVSIGEERQVILKETQCDVLLPKPCSEEEFLDATMSVCFATTGNA